MQGAIGPDHGDIERPRMPGDGTVARPRLEDRQRAIGALLGVDRLRRSAEDQPSLVAVDAHGEVEQARDPGVMRARAERLDLDELGPGAEHGAQVGLEPFGVVH
ncbi:MAG: hypothetical protein R3F65_14810 [bacterium]